MQKLLFKQIQIFLRNWSFSNVVRKTKFLSISVVVFEIVTFWLKRKVLFEFPPKCFSTTERHNLAVFGSLCGENLFFKYLFLFNVLIKNCCINNFKFSWEFSVFKHGKKNNLSENFRARFWDSHFYVKKKFSMNYSQNASKQQKGII